MLSCQSFDFPLTIEKKFWNKNYQNLPKSPQFTVIILTIMMK